MTPLQTLKDQLKPHLDIEPIMAKYEPYLPIKDPLLADAICQRLENELTEATDGGDATYDLINELVWQFRITGLRRGNG